MADAVIIDAVRTPLGRGRPGGALAGVHPVDLLAHPLAALVERTGLDPRVIDDVINKPQQDPSVGRPRRIQTAGGATASRRGTHHDPRVRD